MKHHNISTNVDKCEIKGRMPEPLYNNYYCILNCNIKL